MNRIRNLFIVIYLLCASLHATANNCPPLGPVFPAPTQLSNNSNFKGHLERITSDLEDALATGQTSFGSIDNNTAYAVQVFASDSATPLLEWYYSGGLADSTNGSKTVKGDSIFRIASISKLLTTYTLLRHIGDGYWDTRITDVLPELRSQASAGKDDPVAYVAWEDVTIGALAGQIAGLPRDLANIGQLLLLPTNESIQAGLPPLSASDIPPCIINETFCDRGNFLRQLELADQLLRHTQLRFTPIQTFSFLDTLWKPLLEPTCDRCSIQH